MEVADEPILPLDDVGNKMDYIGEENDLCPNPLAVSVCQLYNQLKGDPGPDEPILPLDDVGHKKDSIGEGPMDKTFLPSEDNQIHREDEGNNSPPNWLAVPARTFHYPFLATENNQLKTDGDPGPDETILSSEDMGKKIYCRGEGNNSPPNQLAVSVAPFNIKHITDGDPGPDPVASTFFGQLKADSTPDSEDPILPSERVDIKRSSIGKALAALTFFGQSKKKNKTNSAPDTVIDMVPIDDSVEEHRNELNQDTMPINTSEEEDYVTFFPPVAVFLIVFIADWRIPDLTGFNTPLHLQLIYILCVPYIIDILGKAFGVYFRPTLERIDKKSVSPVLILIGTIFLGHILLLMASVYPLYSVGKFTIDSKYVFLVGRTCSGIAKCLLSEIMSVYFPSSSNLSKFPVFQRFSIFPVFQKISKFSTVQKFSKYLELSNIFSLSLQVFILSISFLLGKILDFWVVLLIQLIVSLLCLIITMMCVAPTSATTHEEETLNKKTKENSRFRLSDIFAVLVVTYNLYCLCKLFKEN